VKLHKHFDHFKYSLLVNKKNILGEYSSFFKPSTWNYVCLRLREVPHFSSGIVERAKRERAWKSPHASTLCCLEVQTQFTPPRTRPCRVSPFLTWGDFHARSRFARSTIPEEKWGTTRSLCMPRLNKLASKRLCIQTIGKTKLRYTTALFLQRLIFPGIRKLCKRGPLSNQMSILKNTAKANWISLSLWTVLISLSFFLFFF